MHVVMSTLYYAFSMVVSNKTQWRSSEVGVNIFRLLTVGEVLVTCQLHQSQQQDGTNTIVAAHDNKPPPLPPKKRHSKFT